MDYKSGTLTKGKMMEIVIWKKQPGNQDGKHYSGVIGHGYKNNRGFVLCIEVIFMSKE